MTFFNTEIKRHKTIKERLDIKETIDLMIEKDRSELDIQNSCCLQDNQH